MEKDKQTSHVCGRGMNAIPTVLALVAAICLWGFVASTATIYSSTLAHEIQTTGVLLARRQKS
jgi:hypothetical protein